MSKLWAVAVALALVYLALWMGLKGGTEPKAPKPSPSPSLVSVLTEAARGDAIGRVPSNQTVRVVSSTPQFFIGPNLTPVSPNTEGATPGFIVTVEADAGETPQTKLIYHASAPRNLVFVRQEPLK
jgi:hypothetical protein